MDGIDADIGVVWGVNVGISSMHMGYVLLRGSAQIVNARFGSDRFCCGWQAVANNYTKEDTGPDPKNDDFVVTAFDESRCSHHRKHMFFQNLLPFQNLSHDGTARQFCVRKPTGSPDGRSGRVTAVNPEWPNQPITIYEWVEYAERTHPPAGSRCTQKEEGSLPPKGAMVAMSNPGPSRDRTPIFWRGLGYRLEGPVWLIGACVHKKEKLKYFEYL